MASTVLQIYELFDQLKLDTKREVVESLQERLEAEEEIEQSQPEKTGLQQAWEDIYELIHDLDLEPYIDDQIEINEIWNICEGIIKNRVELSSEPWSVRLEICKDIADHDFFDWYGVYDPMTDLLNALCFNDDQTREVADYMWTSVRSSHSEAAKLYEKIGDMEKKYLYLEETLGRDSAPYIELVKYYTDKDEEKALQIAEKGRVKCTRNLDELYIFMLKAAKRRGDEAEINRLIRSAKAKRGADQKHILEEAGIYSVC